MAAIIARIRAIRERSPKAFDLAVAFLLGCALTGAWWATR